jgi:hypothetical protein
LGWRVVISVSFCSFLSVPFAMAVPIDCCDYCCADLSKVPRWIYADGEDFGVCVSCHEEQEAAYKYRVAARKRDEERRKRFPTGPLFTCCDVCDAYIARETWVDDVKPEKCAACLENARNYELHKKFCEEMREIRAAEEAAAPAIIEAMRHVFGKCDSTCAGCVR